jgi:hypothetical protein
MDENYRESWFYGKDARNFLARAWSLTVDSLVLLLILFRYFTFYIILFLKRVLAIRRREILFEGWENREIKNNNHFFLIIRKKIIKKTKVWKEREDKTYRIVWIKTLESSSNRPIEKNKEKRENKEETNRKIFKKNYNKID